MTRWRKKVGGEGKTRRGREYSKRREGGCRASRNKSRNSCQSSFVSVSLRIERALFGRKGLGEEERETDRPIDR